MENKSEFYDHPEGGHYEERITVSEKQLLASKKLEDESKYFHCFDKGCKLAPIMVASKSKVNGNSTTMKGYFCRTHDAKCHRDGWQVGRVFGTNRLKLKK